MLLKASSGMGKRESGVRKGVIVGRGVCVCLCVYLCVGGVALSIGEGGVRWLHCETERHLCNLALCITTFE